MKHYNIVVFDDECLLCNRSVQFIIKHDAKKLFYFTSMHSELAQKLRSRCHSMTPDLDTILVIKQRMCYQKSDAVLEILKEFGGLWHLSRVLKLIPSPVRDFFYDWIARHRHKVFKSKGCIIPSQKLRERML